MKNPQFWIPFFTWIISVAAVSFFIFAFFELTAAASFVYAVIVLTAFYIMLKSRKGKKK